MSRARRTRAGLLGTAALAGVLLAAGTASAQATLLTGPGGPDDFGVNGLPPGNEGTSPPIDLMLAFPEGLVFGGNRWFSLFVNMNGAISFGTPVEVYSSNAFPGSPNILIAPWWANVDTTPAMPEIPHEGVFWNVAPGQFVATWNLVGYFDGRFDRLDSFQLVITDPGPSVPPGDFDLEFRYNRCEWTSTTSSTGTVEFARAGYDTSSADAGPAPVMQLPGSGTSAIARLCSASNVRDPGVWHFAVRGGAVVVCGNNMLEPSEECDGPRFTPPGFGCTSDCHLCGGDAFPSCSPGDSGVPDTGAPDVSFPDVMDVVMRDTADAGAPDVPMDVGTDIVFPDIQVDAAMDIATPDVAVDAATDMATADLGVDAGVDVPGVDMGVDAAMDVPGVDMGVDAAADIAMADRAIPDVAMADVTAMDAAVADSTPAADAGRMVVRYSSGGACGCRVVGGEAAAPRGRAGLGLLAGCAVFVARRRRRGARQRG